MRVSIWSIMMGLVAFGRVTSIPVVTVAAAQQQDSGSSRRVATTAGHNRALRSPMLQGALAADLREATPVGALQAIAHLGVLKLLYGGGVLGSPKSVAL